MSDLLQTQTVSNLEPEADGQKVTFWFSLCLEQNMVIMH
jgi:hypothetical protein